jgi:hypothetical protein
MLDNNVKLAQGAVASAFLMAGGISTRQLKKTPKRSKKLKEGITTNSDIIKQEGITLLRVEKSFKEIDENIKKIKFFVSKTIQLSSEELVEKKQPEQLKRKVSQEQAEKQPEQPKPRLPFFRLLRLPIKKPKPRPKPRLRKRKPRISRRVRTSARRRALNRKLRRFLARLKARAANRLRRLRNVENYRNRVRQQRQRNRIERARLRRQYAEARSRINSDRNRIIGGAETDAQRTRVSAENEARRITNEAEARARATLATTEAETRRITAEAEAESRRKIDAANQQLNEANQRTQQLNEESRRLETQRRQYINDAADASLAVEERKAELKRVQADTAIAAAERDKIVARQQELIREFETAKITLRDAAAQLDIQRQAIDAKLAEEQRRVASIQNTIDESNRLAEQRRIQNAVASGTVPQQPTIEPARPVPQTTPETPRPIPQTPPAVERTPSQQILTQQQRANAKLIAQSKIIAKTAELARRKAPAIGLVIAGGLIGWQLIQGKVTLAVITAAETLDPTWFGVTALTILPAIKLETYQATFGLDPNIDPENPGGILSGPKYKEISDIVDAEWEEAKKKLQDSLEKTKKEWKEKWRRDLDRGILPTLRESVNLNTPIQRGRGRNVTPAAGPGAEPAGQGAEPVGKPPPGSLLMPNATVADAIKKASQMIGVDESILLAMAKQESTFNAAAKADTSSAKGLFQFLDSTWNDMIRKYGKQYPQLYNGPYDALASSIAGALYIKENSKILERAGIPLTGTNIYATHFLGPGGARRLLGSNPNALAASILPDAARANKNIFYKKGDIRFPRTVKEVIDELYIKVGQYADQYASLLRNQNIGTQIGQTSTALATAEQSRGTGSNPIIVNNNNTVIVGAAKPTGASSRTESVARVG